MNISAIEKAVADGVKVINLSIANYRCAECDVINNDSMDQAWLNAEKAAMADVVGLLKQHDVLLIVAAGNRLNIDAKWTGGLQALACEELSNAGNLLWVASVGDPELAYSWIPSDSGFSTWQKKWYGLTHNSSFCRSAQNGVAAPGARIFSLVPPNFLSPAATGYRSGTSMAAPFVTGIASLIRDKWPKLTAAEVKWKIIESATRNHQVEGNTRLGKAGQPLPLFVVDANAALQDTPHLPPSCARGCNCDADTGKCLSCKTGYTGGICDKCDVGYTGYPFCQPVAGWTCDGPMPTIDWKNRTPIDEGSTSVASAVVNSQIHIFGGMWAFKHRVYDTVSDTWTERAQLPITTGNGAAAVTVGGNMFGFGDSDAGKYTIRWDTKADTWTYLSTLASLKIRPNAGIINDRVYFAGGSGLNSEKLNIYDSSRDVWSEGTPLPGPSAGMAAAIYASKFYLFGGDPNNRLAKSYDTVRNVWSDLPPLPAARYNGRAVVMGSQIWVMGGSDFAAGNSPQSTIDRYDIPTNEWCKGPSLPEALMTFIAEQVNGKIYIIGGETSTHFTTTIVREGVIK